jgi:predicted DNA-binding protein (MmcQ/YjbR family)
MNSITKTLVEYELLLNPRIKSAPHMISTHWTRIACNGNVRADPA